MATLRQSKVGGHGGGTSPSVTLDSQAVSGNLLVVIVTNGNQNITQTATSGWTQKVAYSARDVTTAIYTKVSNGTETTLQPCTLSVAQGGPITAFEMTDTSDTVLNAQSSQFVGQTSATINSVVDGVGFAAVAAFSIDFTTESANNGWTAVPTGFMDGGGNGIGFYHTGVTSSTSTASWSPSCNGTIVQLTLTDTGGGGGTELTENKTDSTQLSDSETVALSYALADIDTITLQDQITYNTRHIRQDNIQLADSFTVTKQIAPSATDSLSLGEQIQMQLDMVMNRTDSLNLSDPVAASLHMQKAQTDTLALTDLTAIELGKFVLITESIGLVDFTTFIQKTELTESTGLEDQVTTALLYLNGFLDLADITDSYTIELYNNGEVSLTELLGISDTFTITLGGSVSMSLADQVMAWLTGLGYTTGSIQDRQYQFLLDRYTTSFGAPPYSLTTSDLQVALGERVRLVLKEEEYTP